MSVGSGPVEFHVNGLAKIYCFNPKQYLGYASEAGVQLELDPKFLPIHTDAYGDQVPEDIQNMGLLATISFELIKWDQTVLDALQRFLTGASGTGAASLGNSPNINDANPPVNLIGTLLKQCNYTFPVIIERTGTVGCETNVQGPYDFAACYVGPDSFNLGTRNTRHKLTIHCLPNLSGQLFTISSGT